jgi:hypothetical protein
MKKDLKLSLSIQCNGQLQIHPPAEKQGSVYHVLHDPTQITRITITAVDDVVQILSLSCGEVVYPNLDQIGSLWRGKQRLTGTNGWIEPGCHYRLVVRYSPKAHHYLAYAVDKFQKKS